MFNINFFTVAFGRYSLFLLPYISAALYMNKNSFAEILMDNPEYVKPRYRQFLNKYFKDRWRVSKIPAQFSKWNDLKRMKSIRWVAKPTVTAKYTYIGDIDILITDKELHKGHVRHSKLIKNPTLIS